MGVELLARNMGWVGGLLARSMGWEFCCSLESWGGWFAS